MTSCWQLALLGHWPRQMSEITKATVFGELEAGRNIYRKYMFLIFFLNSSGSNIEIR